MTKKIFSLDLGNKLLKICVGEEDDNGRITLLTKLSKNIDSFSDGEIIDQENFVSEVINVLKDIAYQIGEEPKNLIISLSSSSFSFQRTKGKIALSERYITDEEIKKCLLIAKASLASTSYEALYEEPIAYFLDTGIKTRDPLGMEARSLEVDLLVIQCLKSSVQKLKKFFAENNLKISLILPNPLPASLILLTKKDKETGAILADFGYKILNLSFFQEGKLIFYQNFKFGFGDILEDLALDFGIDLAEMSKIFNELSVLEDKKKKLKVKIGRQKYSYYNLLKLLEKKFAFYWKKNNLNELFKKIKETHRLPSGIYLIGGGSYLQEIETIFKKYSTYPIKLGNDLFKTLNPDERIYLNALGAIYYYQRVYQPKSFWEKLQELFSFLR